MGLPGSGDSLTIVDPFRHNTSVWRTDGRTDVQPIAITCAVWLTHVKNDNASWLNYTKFIIIISNLLLLLLFIICIIMYHLHPVRRKPLWSSMTKQRPPLRHPARLVSYLRHSLRWASLPLWAGLPLCCFICPSSLPLPWCCLERWGPSRSFDAASEPVLLSRCRPGNGLAIGLSFTTAIIHHIIMITCISALKMAEARSPPSCKVQDSTFVKTQVFKNDFVTTRSGTAGNRTR